MKKLILIAIAFITFQLSNAQVPDVFPDGIILGSFATDPTGFRAGQLYYNTTDSVVKFYNGTVWSDLGGSIPTIQQVLTEGNQVGSGTRLIFNGQFGSGEIFSQFEGLNFDLKTSAASFENTNGGAVAIRPNLDGVSSVTDHSNYTSGSNSSDRLVYTQRGYVDDAIANVSGGSGAVEVVETASTNYTLLEADIQAWKFHKFTGNDITITIPAITYTDFVTVLMQHTGTGTVTIQSGAGVTFPNQTFTTDKLFSIVSDTDDVWRIGALEIEGAAWNEITGDQTDVNLIGFTDGLPAQWNDLEFNISRPMNVVTDGNGVFLIPMLNGNIYRSDDSLNTWSLTTVPNTGAYFSRIDTDGSGTWIASGTGSQNQNFVLRSTDDGLTWTQVSLTDIRRWNDVKYGNGVWIVVSSNSATSIVKRSTDGGITWVDVPITGDIGATTLSTNGSGFWVADDGFSPMYSIDNGLTWTKATAITTTVPNYSFATRQFGIGNGNNNIIHIYKNTVDNRFYTIVSSDFGESWTETLINEIPANIISLSGVRYSANNNEKIYINFGNSSPYSTILTKDAGTTWNVVADNLLQYAEFMTDDGNTAYFTAFSDTENLFKLVSKTKFENTVNEYQLNGVTLPIVDKILNIEVAESVLEGYNESGTRVGNNLVVGLGDYDNSGNGTKITITDNTGRVQVGNGLLVNDSNQSVGIGYGFNAALSVNELNATIDIYALNGVSFSNISGFKTILSSNGVFTNNTIEFPNASGTMPLSISNGGGPPLIADTQGNIDISSILGGGGGGDVTKVGTPLDNQVAVWTGDGTIEGTTNLTFDNGTGNMNLSGVVTANAGMISNGGFQVNQVGESLIFNTTSPLGGSHITWNDGGLKGFFGFASNADDGIYLTNQEASNIQFGTSTRTNDLVINSAGNITATGSITANSFVGSGATLTGVVLPTTRLTASIAGVTDIDWSGNNLVKDYTLTAATTLNDINLPTGTATKVLEMVITGDFPLTIDPQWVGFPNNDIYIGTGNNHFVVTVINGNSGQEKIYYSLTNL